jgi:diguanylate cyclase (GGDEF)-like protein
MYAAISGLIQRLQNSNEQVKKMNYSLSNDIKKATAQLTEKNKYLYNLSTKDHLTKIANRRYFEMSMEKLLRQPSKERIGIILIDVDKFKFINDEYGHDAGDLALKHISRILHQTAKNLGLPARLGGDEFVIYIKDPSKKSLYYYAEDLRSIIADSPIIWQNKTINLSLSLGTVDHDIDGLITLDQLFKYADEAMYESKENGRNHVSQYNFDKSSGSDMPTQSHDIIASSESKPESQLEPQEETIVEKAEDSKQDDDGLIEFSLN